MSAHRRSGFTLVEVVAVVSILARIALPNVQEALIRARAAAAMGDVEVVRTAYPDPTDETGRFVCVDVRAVKPVAKPVTLTDVKAEPRLHHLSLVRHSRLSVQPVDDAAWRLILKMSGTKP